jgi:branched-chain amino acid aminotransferase
MDGRFVDWDDATVHVLTPTLHYGWGVFEGIRAYPTERGPAVFRLTDHIARLFRSAHIYLMEPASTPAEFVAAVKELVRVNELEAGYIRPLLYLGYGEMGLNPLPSPTKAAIACWPWGAYLGEEAAHNGVRVMVSSFERISHNSLPPAAKTTGQYINSSLAKVQALKAGYDEAILLTPQGYIAEGPGENVFAVYEVIERSLTRADLYVADEAWFTGTAAEMVPIVEIDDRRIGTGRPGPVAKQLLELYGQAVRGQLDRYKDWCEYVTE